MDFNLRCNSLECRANLDHLAVVTTCSHIFCTNCADSLLIKQTTASRHLGTITPTCPACHTELKSPDDIVKTNLNPTDDYKTSVLSGLSPNLILEIAGRGISFWMYQTTQEIVYQEYLSKTLTDKFNALSTQLDNVIHEANTEIKALRDKLQTLTLENETISRKNHELGEALREKSRKHLQVQESYDKLKRKQLLTQVQNAATTSIDRALGPLQGPPGSSNGVQARLSDLTNTSNRNGGREEHVRGGTRRRDDQIRGDMGSRMGQRIYADRERLTIPSGGSEERREGSMSDGNSEGGRRISSRVPTHGRVGTAEMPSWNDGVGMRQNLRIDVNMTPLQSQDNRQRMGPLVASPNAQRQQNWGNSQQKHNNTNNPAMRSTGPHRQILNEMSANIGVGRPRFSLDGLQQNPSGIIDGGNPATLLRPQSQQFIGTTGGASNRIYLG